MTQRISEYVVIGAGIYGVATAWELARRGHQVTVLEARRVAGGASGGLGWRGVRANGRDPRELPLMRDAYARWPALGAELGAPVPYERTGHLLLYERERDLASAEARAWTQEGLGIPTRVLDRVGVQRIEPGLAEGVIGALLCPLDGVADHGTTTLAYATAARRLGAQIHEGAPVAELSTQGGRVTAAVLEDGSRIGVGRGVLLLANAGAPGLLDRSLGVELPVWPVFPQALRSSPSAHPPFSSLIGHAHRPLALKMLPDGSVMASGGWRGRWDAELGCGVPVPERVTGNWSEAVAVFPELATLKVVDARADRTETASVDGIPIVDRAPGVDNAIFAVGWTGHGWAIAPAVAPLLAAWAADGQQPELLRPFALGRFAPPRSAGGE
jgi:sarcosine oxidase subunit beta